MPNFAHLADRATAIVRPLAFGLLILSAAFVPVVAARADAESDWRAGFAAGARGEYELALRYYSRAIHAGWLPPRKMAQVFYNRATAHLRLGDLDWAIQDYSVAIWLRPDFADAYHNRGLALRRNGEHLRADDDLAHALALGRVLAAESAAGETVPEPIAPVAPPTIEPPSAAAVIAVPSEPRTLALAAEPPLALAAEPLPARAPAGGYAMHVASFRSKAVAEGEWRRLKRRLPDLLADQNMTVVRIALARRGVYYRLLVGSFADSAAAAEACADLKAARQTCRPVPLVVADEGGPAAHD